MGCRLWGPRGRREYLPAKGLHIPPGGQLLAPTVHHVQLFAAVVIVGVGVSDEDILQDMLEGLIPELPLSRSSVAVVSLLLARLVTWR
jgi:hypothetical protein